MAPDPIQRTHRIIYLLSKRVQTGLSAEEEDEILYWRNTSAENEGLFRELSNKESIHELVCELKQYDVDQSFHRLKKRFAKKSYKRIWSFYVAAASIVLLISLGILFNKSSYFFLNKDEPDILPGGHQAQLTLYDGSHIDLDSMQVGETRTRLGIQLKKDENGKITFNYNTDAAELPKDATFNTIRTPIGGEYQLILPDGSTVWLNSNSALKFPTRFNGEERYVELSGEGYFEVTSDSKKPFKVATEKQVIQVLGTSFNILAYSDDIISRTTLVAGSIRVSTALNNQLLKPGQEVRVDKHSTQLQVVQANIHEATAWKNGYFMFNEEGIESIMRKVSRWYNVEVTYQGDVKEKAFGGTFSKEKTLRKLMDSLKETGQIQYKLEGRRLTIM